MDFSQRLRLILPKDQTQAEVADKIGVSLSSLRNWLSGTADPSMKYLEKIAELYGRFSLHWLITGAGPASTMDELQKYEDAMIAGAENFVFLPRYDVKAAAGAGIAASGEHIVDYLAFKRDWVAEELGVKARDLLLIEAQGDSMNPTIKDGALLLIHKAETRARNNAVYALSIDGDLVVKRVTKLTSGNLLISSDNEAYGAEEISGPEAGNLNVIGRVVWAGGRL